MGFCSVKDRDRTNSFIKRSKRSGYCADEVRPVNELFADADMQHEHYAAQAESSHLLLGYIANSGEAARRYHSSSCAIARSESHDFVI